VSNSIQQFTHKTRRCQLLSLSLSLKIDRLSISLSCLRIFHSYGDVITSGKFIPSLWNLGLCLALWSFEQRGIFIVLHHLWHGTLVFPVSSKGQPHQVASYDRQEGAEDLFLPGSSRVYPKGWNDGFENSSATGVLFGILQVLVHLQNVALRASLLQFILHCSMVLKYT
jgi:hypothetical protein